MYFADGKHKREPQSDSLSAVRKHTPLSITILYNITRKNARQILEVKQLYIEVSF